MTISFRDPALRGSRRTRPLAVGLCVATLAMGVVLVVTVVWGVSRGWGGGEPMELMTIDAPANLHMTPPAPEAAEAAQTIAPSRPAPAIIPNVALSAADPAAVEALERQLIDATADAGPELGSVEPTVIDTTPAQPTFDGRPLRPVRTVRMLTTAYSPDERSCGIYADGITASGYSVWTNGMKLVAADTDHYPFGSILTIPGYNGGRPVPVLDRGGRIKGHRLDLLYPTHERALQWGAQRLDVTVWEYADED